MLNYDPGFKDVLDIQITYNPDSLGFIKKKELVKAVEDMHAFSRLSKSYLYDEKSLELVTFDDTSAILSYRYEGSRLEPELKFGKKVRQVIHRIFLTAQLPLSLQKGTARFCFLCGAPCQ
ncbi:hypothetical protein [Flavihumibacter fluvii]|uniref:hypothetical protein n=1 Tax=Flavihumibacter fluvii TaxID=2838157 RepID=UPI001BDE41FF|nr:hypothetical protein [Flavihumibacter fluvii]ULQ51155.1 hypothetical protein KJS93_13785 [Flavihumibacter fluvii]